MSRARLIVVLLAAIVALVLVPAGAFAQRPPGHVIKDRFGILWHRVGVDGFTRGAKPGTWTGKYGTVVYVGDHGMRWRAYPDGASCDGIPDCYMPSRVLTVHGGTLDYWLHQCRYPDGRMSDCGAAPLPGLRDGTQFRTYGRFAVRFELTRRVAGYRMAWLLWPTSQVDGWCAESDFPELNLSDSIAHAFAHYRFNGQCINGHSVRYTVRLTTRRWHKAVQEWGPGFRRYWFDGRYLGADRNQVWSGPERWSLQITGCALLPTDCRESGQAHVLVDWIWIGRYG